MMGLLSENYIVSIAIELSVKLTWISILFFFLLSPCKENLLKKEKKKENPTDIWNTEHFACYPYAYSYWRKAKK
jgi:hypothetical protein